MRQREMRSCASTRDSFACAYLGAAARTVLRRPYFIIARWAVLIVVLAHLSLAIGWNLEIMLVFGDMGPAAIVNNRISRIL